MISLTSINTVCSSSKLLQKSKWLKKMGCAPPAPPSKSASALKKNNKCISRCRKTANYLEILNFTFQKEACFLKLRNIPNNTKDSLRIYQTTVMGLDMLFKHVFRLNILLQLKIKLSMLYRSKTYPKGWSNPKLFHLSKLQIYVTNHVS